MRRTRSNFCSKLFYQVLIFIFFTLTILGCVSTSRKAFNANVIKGVTLGGIHKHYAENTPENNLCYLRIGNSITTLGGGVFRLQKVIEFDGETVSWMGRQVSSTDRKDLGEKYLDGYIAIIPAGKHSLTIDFYQKANGFERYYSASGTLEFEAGVLYDAYTTQVFVNEKPEIVLTTNVVTQERVQINNFFGKEMTFNEASNNGASKNFAGSEQSYVEVSHYSGLAEFNSWVPVYTMKITSLDGKQYVYPTDRTTVSASRHRVGVIIYPRGYEAMTGVVDHVFEKGKSYQIVVNDTGSSSGRIRLSFAIVER